MTRVMKRQLEEELNLERDLAGRTRPSALPPPLKPKRTEPVDDRYSPAHAAGSPGTGVPPPADADKARNPADGAPHAPSEDPGDGATPHETT
jgi:hypothetical protein